MRLHLILLGFLSLAGGFAGPAYAVPNYYEFLGLDQDASARQIEAAIQQRLANRIRYDEIVNTHFGLQAEQVGLEIRLLENQGGLFGSAFEEIHILKSEALRLLKKNHDRSAAEFSRMTIAEGISLHGKRLTQDELYPVLRDPFTSLAVEQRIHDLRIYFTEFDLPAESLRSVLVAAESGPNWS